MIDDLKPYPVYKDIGLPWLGKVPGHWEEERAKGLFAKVERPIRPEDEIVTCFRDGNVTLRKNRRLRGYTEAIYELGYQGIRKGDLVIHAMDAFAGATGVSDSDGKGSPIYGVCRPKSDANPHYYAHVVREMARSQWILALSRGIRERSTDFRFESFGRQFVPCPPPDEQAAIVRFLDHANGKIERAIRAKRKLIVLLNEQKQAIIHRAVTRGLDPAVKLKPSGIPWLGEVPEHWIAVSLRQRYHQCLGKMVDSKKATGKYLIPYLRNFDVRWGYINKSALPLIDIAPNERERYTVKPGDLLICEGRHLGRSAIWDGGIEICGFQKALHRLRPISFEADDPKFLQYVMIIANATDAFHRNKIDNAIPHLTGEMLRAHRFAFPPIYEQKKIASYLESYLRQHETAISRTEREIKLLREYRTRLTADVVTGKVDVREAAKRLPDAAEELPPADELTDEVEDGIEPEGE